MSKSIALGITGASGSIYAQRFLELILPVYDRVYLMLSDAGLQVCRYELKSKKGSFLLNCLKNPGEKIKIFSPQDYFSPLGSGSLLRPDLVVLPCSMGCLARIHAGTSTQLIERFADVVLKEKRRLILCPRETPLSPIHLRNMLALAEWGVQIVPPMAAFYHRPQSLDEVVDHFIAKILDLLHIEHDLVSRWAEQRS